MSRTNGAKLNPDGNCSKHLLGRTFHKKNYSEFLPDLFLILHSWEWEVEHLHADNAEDVINCPISIDLLELLIHSAEELLCKSVS